MFVAGALTLALSYRFSNPGKRVQVKLPTGDIQSKSYNCTIVPSNGVIRPTIWFEASDAHGVVDFLGLQQSLALVHGRNSCSYDPPNFGFSDKLPSHLPDSYTYFKPLLEALSKQDEEKVIIGWGDGAHRGLIHTHGDPHTTKAFVLLDVAPDGIEFFDEQRKKKWDEKQMQAFRKSDLTGRIFLTQIILAIAIPWGLMPIFVPNDPKGYYDQSLYNRFRSQAYKEDLWALQYLALVRMASEPIDDYLARTTVPQNMPTYAIITKHTAEPATDNGKTNFYLTSMLDMANHMAGGNLTLPPVLCEELDCSQGNPVTKPQWTADAIMSFPI